MTVFRPCVSAPVGMKYSDGIICRSHGLKHHFYADDSQLYLSFKPFEAPGVSEALQRIESCLSDIVSWMHKNMLKLNEEKTVVILFTSKHNTKHLESVYFRVGNSNVLETLELCSIQI